MENKFGLFLAEKRKAQNLTQKELASKLFVSESTISKWEKGKANPDISMIADISKILKVSEHELISASEDREERERVVNARKWKRLSLTWEWFFLISYAITLLTCFIVNLATGKTLSWFFVVLFSLILAFSFTNLPKYIKKCRLFLITIIELISLILLLFVCERYTNGSWLLLAVVPVLLGFSIIFLPLYIKTYSVFNIIKKHNAIISITADLIMAILTLFVIEKKTNGNWLLTFSIPLTFYVFLFIYFFACIVSYVKKSKTLKTSILTFSFIPFFIGLYFIVKALINKQFGLSETLLNIGKPNLLKWNSETLISSNVILLIFLALTIISISFLICHLVSKKKQQSK